MKTKICLLTYANPQINQWSQTRLKSIFSVEHHTDIVFFAKLLIVVF